MIKRTLATLAVLVALAASAAAQVTIPNTLVAGSVIRAADLNTNFSTLGNHALDRLSGGNLSGNITADGGVTIDGIDIGATLCPSCSPTFAGATLTGNLSTNSSFVHTADTTTLVTFPANGQVSMSLSGTQRFLLNASGLTIFGNNILDTSGKVPAISSTYFASLSAANLTGIPAAQLTGDVPAGVTKESSAINIAGRQTLWVPAASITPTVTSGATGPLMTELTAGQPNINVLSFTNGSQSNGQFSIAFPKSWNASTVTYQAYWTGTVAGAGTTIWGLQCVASADNATIDAAFGTAQEVTDTFLTVKFNHVSPESSALTISGAAADTHTTCQVYRKSSDTRAQVSLLLGIKLYFTTNAKNDI